MPIGVGVEDRIIAAMRGLGFTATDAKAYVALLKESPASGYELAARSSVPRSAIYNVLRSMESQGLVNKIQDKPARYVPLAPAKLTHMLGTRFNKSIDELETSLDGLVGPAIEAATWTVQGYGAMIEQAENLIQSSKRSVYASLWGREATQLAPVIEAQIAAGVDVVLFSFNPLPESLGEVLSYGIPENELEPYWSHKVIMIADDARVLVGGAEQTDNNRAVITEEPALVEMAISNLVLDLTLFGQRSGRDIASVIERLTTLLPPLDDLVAERFNPAVKSKD